MTMLTSSEPQNGELMPHEPKLFFFVLKPQPEDQRRCVGLKEYIDVLFIGDCPTTNTEPVKRLRAPEKTNA